MKKTVILIIVTILSGGPLLCAENGTEKTKDNTNQPAKQVQSDQDTSKGLTSKDDNSSGDIKNLPPGNDSNPLVMLVYALFLVMVLAIAAFFLGRKVLPKISAGKSRNLKIVDTLALGQNRAVHIIEISGKSRLLIGATLDNINLLTALDSDNMPNFADRLAEADDKLTTNNPDISSPEV